MDQLEQSQVQWAINYKDNLNNIAVEDAFRSTPAVDAILLGAAKNYLSISKDEEISIIPNEPSEEVEAALSAEFGEYSVRTPEGSTLTPLGLFHRNYRFIVDMAEADPRLARNYDIGPLL